MTKDEESAFRQWWCNYEITRKKKSEIVAKDAFHAGVSALMLVKQTLENDNAILRKRNAELIQENEEMKKGLGCETCQIHLEFAKLNQKITELEAQIEKMKCCQNCKNTWNGYRMNICEDCSNKSKWEIKEND